MSLGTSPSPCPRLTLASSPSPASPPRPLITDGATVHPSLGHRDPGLAPDVSPQPQHTTPHGLCLLNLPSGGPFLSVPVAPALAQVPCCPLSGSPPQLLLVSGPGLAPFHGARSPHGCSGPSGESPASHGGSCGPCRPAQPRRRALPSFRQVAAPVLLPPLSPPHPAYSCLLLLYFIPHPANLLPPRSPPGLSGWVKCTLGSPTPAPTTLIFMVRDWICLPRWTVSPGRAGPGYHGHCHVPGTARHRAGHTAGAESVRGTRHQVWMTRRGAWVSGALLSGSGV